MYKKRTNYRGAFINENCCSTTTSVTTALPSFIPGVNRHFLIASTALASSPYPNGRDTAIRCGIPPASTTTRNSSVP